MHGQSSPRNNTAGFIIGTGTVNDRVLLFRDEGWILLRRTSGFIHIPYRKCPGVTHLDSTRKLGAGALVDRDLRFAATEVRPSLSRWVSFFLGPAC